MFNNQSTGILFRCDASWEIGSGHVMRCISLARELKATGFRVVFLTNSGGAEVLRGFVEFTIEVESIHEKSKETLQILESINKYEIKYLIWDSYQLNQENLTAVSTRVLTMVVDDIYLLSVYECDAILNPNIYASREKYSTTKQTNMLLGLNYLMLRPSFSNLKGQYLIENRVNRILLTFGGSDEYNLTRHFCEWLNEFETFNLKISLVLGSHYQFKQELFEYLDKPSLHEYKVYHNVKAMADLLIQQDIVICAGGSTMYELACLGIPACPVITAENQRELVETFGRYGACEALGDVQSLSKPLFQQSFHKLVSSNEIRLKMSRLGSALVDGRGASRVAEYIQKRLTGV
ncbi:UDP-2,4-diacetamido-2,4,6-trideoxy-beta-L-altropyranose hydrolase [Cohnella silvisoli]|uniref:UDP-2,4-diacetamido-2,4, 6-trideoxy-beta-L-altropyranose hydrolase n=1 Tax=Cohnella silvisoli TaxID=2873699 RepID=A0ABV1KPR8_9BACL|nr:UDP-2,4-diacetamido-2,4,6-trideoxy-beta-L-altropyranose hydrolase [Cohnella silvisoli]MCD9022315.1 UDP-2,4-diacetamido-2,4,6-trideoxy-beta-L-altropyranose hydrolase [Cohnella silvisoli]